MVTELTPDTLIEMTFKGALKRAPDPSGREAWKRRLSQVGLDGVISGLISSPEFETRYLYNLIQQGGMDRAKKLASLLVHYQIPQFLHPPRVDLVRNVVPAARQVLDLGGASARPQGALLEMGYPHAKQITIVDLPVELRMKPGPDVRELVLYQGTEVLYQYHTMADLSRYPDESFDLVWSGQTFEHITEQEGAALFPQVRRVLRRGGIFALDTPNRTITRLTVGDGMLIHAEHKIEYEFADFLRRFTNCGMDLIDMRGILDMPETLLCGYGVLEDLKNGTINSSPWSSYCFYVAFRKP